MRNEFWTVIAANVGRLAFLPNDFLHEPNQASCRYGMRNFLCNGHTVAVVDDIEHAELAVALQNVSNEVHRPGDIFLVRCLERILDSGWQAFAQRLSLVEMNRLVDTMNLLMVPGKPINLHARVMLMSCSSAISPTIRLQVRLRF